MPMFWFVMGSVWLAFQAAVWTEHLRMERLEAERRKRMARWRARSFQEIRSRR